MSGVFSDGWGDCFKFLQPPQGDRKVLDCFAPARDFFATNVDSKPSKKLTLSLTLAKNSTG
jgi:hypothetical protein